MPRISWTITEQLTKMPSQSDEWLELHRGQTYKY